MGPNIKSPKEMDSGFFANKIMAINDENNDRNIHDEIKLKKRKNGHSHSQSLHGADLNKMLDDIKRPRLRPSNSEKPSTSKHSKKSLKKALCRPRTYIVVIFQSNIQSDINGKLPQKYNSIRRTFRFRLALNTKHWTLRKIMNKQKVIVISLSMKWKKIKKKI